MASETAKTISRTLYFDLFWYALRNSETRFLFASAFFNCPPIENWDYHLFDLAGTIRDKVWLFVWLRTLEYVYYEDEPGRRALVRISQAR
jgi:hypothetical protein